jgi:hypothetical protein
LIQLKLIYESKCFKDLNQNYIKLQYQTKIKGKDLEDEKFLVPKEEKI